jgi:hypothetical protein
MRLPVSVASTAAAVARCPPAGRRACSGRRTDAADAATLDAAPIRVLLGPQDDYFTAASQACFLSEVYQVSPRCRSHGHASAWTHAQASPRQRRRDHLGRDRSGVDSGTGSGTADRAARRRPDRRRISEDRDGDLGRFAAPGGDWHRDSAFALPPFRWRLPNWLRARSAASAARADRRHRAAGGSGRLDLQAITPPTWSAVSSMPARSTPRSGRRLLRRRIGKIHGVHGIHRGERMTGAGSISTPISAKASAPGKWAAMPNCCASSARPTSPAVFMPAIRW